MKIKLIDQALVIVPETDFERGIISEFKSKKLGTQVVGDTLEVIQTISQNNLPEQDIF